LILLERVKANFLAINLANSKVTTFFFSSFIQTMQQNFQANNFLHFLFFSAISCEGNREVFYLQNANSVMQISLQGKKVLSVIQKVRI